MSILDKGNMLAEDQTVTASAITDVIDLDPNGTGNIPNPGAGAPLYWFVLCTDAMTDTGSDSTLTPTLESDSTANLATAATVHDTLTPFPATSAAGTFRWGQIPPQTNFQRYLGVRLAPAGGDLSAGDFTVGLTRDIDAWKAYASGMNFA